MIKYAGICDVHGIITHATSQKSIDIKGGKFCPLCGKLVKPLKK